MDDEPRDGIFVDSIKEKQFATPLGMSSVSDELWEEIMGHANPEGGWSETANFLFYTARVDGESTLTTTGEAGYFQKRAGGKILQHIFLKESWDKDKALDYLNGLAEKVLKGGEGSGWFAPPKGTHVGKHFVVYQPTAGPYKDRYVQLGDYKVSVVMDQEKGKFKISDLEKAISECPREHVDTLLSGSPEGLKISVRDAISNDRRGGQYQAKRDSMSIATKGRNKADIRQTVHHEVGHRAQEVKGLRDDPRWNKLVDARLAIASTQQLHSSMWLAQDYFERGDASTGYREFFATSYASIISDKNAFAKSSPELFSYMQEKVFGG